MEHDQDHQHQFPVEAKKIKLDKMVFWNDLNIWAVDDQPKLL